MIDFVKQSVDYYNAKFGWDEEGATAVEYGIMVALIAAVIIAIVLSIGQKLLSAFTTVDSNLPAN
jgi:pilus assembly protein Flp/PilA